MWIIETVTLLGLVGTVYAVLVVSCALVDGCLV